MTQARTRPSYVLLEAAALGLLVGFLGARVAFLSTGLCLVPWAIGGLALGVWCRPTRLALAAGALFGFVLAFTFMAAAYDGSDPVLDVLWLFVVLGLFGALCGVALTAIGRRLAPGRAASSEA